MDITHIIAMAAAITKEGLVLEEYLAKSLKTYLAKTLRIPVRTTIGGIIMGITEAHGPKPL